MWNLVGFVVMVSVLFTARWALGIWDSTQPMPFDASPVTTAQVYEPVESTTHPVPWEYIPAPVVNLPQQR